MKRNEDTIPVRIQAELEIGGERSPVVVRRLSSDGLSAELAQAVAARLSPGQEVALICSLPQEANPIRWMGKVAEVGRDGAEGGVPVEFGLSSMDQEDPLRTLRQAFTGVILLVGFDGAESAFLEQRLAGEFDLLTASNLDEVGEIQEQRTIAVVCTGSELEPEAALALLHQVSPLPIPVEADEPTGESAEFEDEDEIAGLEASNPAHEGFSVGPDSVHLNATHLNPAHLNIVLAAGPEPELFQDFIDLDQLYYLAQKMPPIEDVSNILQSAIERYRASQQQDENLAHDEEKRVETQRVLQVVRLLGGETEVSKAAELIGRASIDLLEAEDAECLLYDRETETLWNRRLGAEERRESAAAGVVSFVLRTGKAVLLDHVGEDPRYDPEADNNGRSPDERFLSVPVIEHHGTTGAVSGRRKVLAVLVASRPANAAPFSPREQARLQFLADQVAPVLSRLLMQARLDAIATRGGSEYGAVFRQEAIEHHNRGFGAQGHMLEISPRWTEWAFRILMIVLVAGLLYTVLGTIYEYASGVAVVQVSDRAEVTTTLAGTVTSVEVKAGEQVSKGQVLVRFYGAQEAAELARVEREFELGLADRLRNPSDAGTERALSTLRAQKQLAESRLEERTLRAPQDGVVSDLRIRPGQHLSLGQIVLALVDERPDLSIVALLPGNFRPLIEPGMPLRLELQGYAYAYQHLTVESVEEEVIGPAEARRVLGPGIGDAVPITGSVVLVRARLPERHFESDGQIYDFHDGMFGTAEVRVRDEPILVTLVPGLKALFSDRHG